MLTSFKRLKSINCILSANLPQQEAYALIKQTEQVLWLSIAGGGVLLAAIVWLIMRYLATPLLSLTKQVRDIRTCGQVDVSTSDEIGDLAAAFNRQMEIIRVNEQLLLRERELFQTLADFSNDWVFWRTEKGDMRYNSPACKHICGYTPEELTAEPHLVERLVDP